MEPAAPREEINEMCSTRAIKISISFRSRRFSWILSFAFFSAPHRSAVFLLHWNSIKTGADYWLINTQCMGNNTRHDQKQTWDSIKASRPEAKLTHDWMARLTTWLARKLAWRCAGGRKHSRWSLWEMKRKKLGQLNHQRCFLIDCDSPVAIESYSGIGEHSKY